MKVDKRRLTRTLKELVRIDSSQNISRISDYVEGKLCDIGLNVIRDSDGNLVSEIGKGEGFLLNAHLDTVPAYWKGAFSGIIKDGRVYGRGSSDCKAGVAAMLEIANLLREEELHNRVVFAFTGNEEDKPLEVNGAYKVAKRIKARRGILLEPTAREDGSIGISVGCRGSYRFSVNVLGKSCHSGHPELGENAIYNACDFIKSLKKIKLPKIRIQGIGKVPAAVNITQIEAKEGTNVIPGKCSLSINYRSLPGEEEEMIRRRIEKICKASLGKKYRVEESIGICGGLCEEREFFEECKKTISGIGYPYRVYFSRSRNDSAIFKKYGGISCYVIGPGIEKQAHEAYEYCSIDCFVKTTEAVNRIVERYAISWKSQPKLGYH